MKQAIEKVYLESSRLLDLAREDTLKVNISTIKREFYSLKFMASVIHNELCREFFYLVLNPTIGTSKIISLGPLILKLYEANNWYFKFGNKRLRELACERGLNSLCDEKLRELKSLKPSRIEKYTVVGNKLAGHYDLNYFELVEEFSITDSDEFFDDVLVLITYGKRWLQLLQSIGKLDSE